MYYINWFFDTLFIFCALGIGACAFYLEKIYKIYKNKNPNISDKKIIKDKNIEKKD